jgi:hypothetical protein
MLRETTRAEYVHSLADPDQRPGRPEFSSRAVTNSPTIRARNPGRITTFRNVVKTQVL